MLSHHRIRALEEASLLLAFGSLWLLAGWLSLVFLIFGWLVIPFHVAAWRRLFRAVRDGFRRESSRLDRVMAALFVLSLAGFAAGLASLSIALPGTTDEQFRVLMAYGLFAYIPSVFAPVAIAHALIFGVAGG